MMKVLICDDSALARKQVKRSLPEEWPIEVSFATNGVEALEQLDQDEISVLFLDLTMPELDGIGVLEAMQGKEYATCIIVISADVQPEMQKRVKELGALSFIRKPVNKTQLSLVLAEYGLI